MKNIIITQKVAGEDYFESNPTVSLKVFMAYCSQSHPPTAPHPALPYLKAYLGEVLPDVNVTQKDLDAIYYAHIFDPKQLNRRFSERDAIRIRRAYGAQREERIYRDISLFTENHQILENALDEISRQHHEDRGTKRESLTLRGNTFTYVNEYRTNTRNGILDAISTENRGKNLFYEFYKDVVVPYIIRKGYDVIAFSIFLNDQLVPTFLLSSMIKEVNPEIRVILGGNYLTRFRDVLESDDKPNRMLFDNIDAIVLNEGEVPFRRLLERIYEGKGFDDINQVIYRGADGKIHLNFDYPLPAMDMDRLPRPDFDGIFTDLEDRERIFWTPTDVISFYTQRGCPYAGGCDFCTVMSGNNRPNSKIARSPQKVAEDMKFYQERHGSGVFSFGNETLSGEFMVELTRELNKLDIDAAIDGYTRTDQFANGELYIKMIKEIGRYFKFLQIGVESSDEETLDSMKKGREPYRDSELVEALFQNGIIPHIFLLIGFPPSKRGYEGKSGDAYKNFYLKSFLQTLKWLRKNARNIGTYKATRLVLPRDDHKMIVNTDNGFAIAERYDHELKLSKNRDLEFNIPYNKLHGNAEFDERATELFDLIPHPYKSYTHATIYHQRMFNWRDGIEWSKTQTSDKIEKDREKRVLQRLWTCSVGLDYVKATQELARGSLGKRKRALLESIRSKVQRTNLMAKHFPEGSPESVEELMEMN